ncbi:Cna B-type domain-containing protein [Ureibacillus sp. GCM10028918]|uniref:Cna B-type domain-containing protein n=1 Tax=Ureibacillus sp. GCM10028918 TaxID=3273429 RepID=UPI00360789AD
MRKLNIGIIVVLLVFQTLLSPIAVFASGDNQVGNEESNAVGSLSDGASKGDNATPGEPGTTPEEPGTTPEEPGTTPEEPGTTPEEPGTTPEEPGTTPEEPGTTPEEPGTTPEEPGTTPEEPGATPEEPGATPGEPGTTPIDPAVLQVEELEGSKLSAELNAVRVLINENPVVEGQPIPQTSRISINFDFAVLLENPKNGDYFTFDLPESLVDWDNNFNGMQPRVDNSIPGFRWETDDNTVTVTLTDIDTSFSGNANITLNFESGFELDNADNDLEQEINVPSPNGGTETITVTFLPSTAEDDAVQKSALATTAEIENGERYIDYAVWINTAGKSLNNATLEDEATGGHELDGNITVTQYEVGLRGVIDATATPLTGGPFNSFNAITLNGNFAYKIEYRTKITLSPEERDGKKPFDNKIVLKEGETVIDEDSAEQVTTTYGKSLAKKLIGDISNYESNWEIHYNYNQLKISAVDAYIEDRITGDHKIDVSQIKVYKMTVDENGNGQGTGVEVSTTDYTVNPSSGFVDTFELEFKKDITEAYRIVYPAVYDEDFNIDGTKVQNFVSSGTVLTEISDGEKTKSQGILTKDHTVDLDTQTITWTIKIKADNKEIKNLTLTDTFTNGSINGVHVLKDGLDGIDIQGISNANEDPVTRQLLSIDPNKDDLSEGLILGNIDIANGGTATITYTTSYHVKDTGEVANSGYGNTADIHWTSDKEYNLEFSDKFVPGTTTVNNGRKWGSFDYEKQLFTWNVVVNANKKDIRDAVLTDTLGTGHEIVEDSFNVYHYTRTNDTSGTIIYDKKLDPNTDYTLTFGNSDEDNKNDQYTLTFNSNLDDNLNNQSYIVIYNTKDTDNILGNESSNNLGKTYKNQATFKVKGETIHNLTPTPSEVMVDVANNLVGKSVSGNESSNKDGILTWTLDVNKSHSSLKNVIVTDTPAESLLLDRSSIQVRPFSVTSTGIKEEGTWHNPSEFGLELSLDEETGGFTIEFGDLERKGYQIQYKTYTLTTEEPNTPENLATITFEGSDNLSDNQKDENKYEEKYAFSRSSAGFSLIKGNVKFHKIGLNSVTEEEENLPGVKFNLYIQDTNILVKENIESGADGTFEIENINYGKYTLKEIDAPEGYQKAEFDFTLDVSNDSKLSENKDNAEAVIKLVNKKAEVTATKVWVGGPIEHPTIELQLYKDGVAVGEPKKLVSGETTVTWTGLDICDECNYTVDEVNVPTNYEKSISEDGLTITNTYVSPKTEITGTKVWVDGPAEHPMIELQLYQNGNVYGEPVILENGETTYTWRDLDETDIDGNEYTYTIDEVTVPENYVRTLSEDKLTVTNTFVVGVTVTKKWVGGPETHPVIQVQLYQQVSEDGEKKAFGEPITLENGTESYTWEGLPETDGNGQKFIYTVDELNVPQNYKKTVVGHTITNTYVIPKTSVTATKEWVGGPSNRRPTIELQLYRNGIAYGEPVVLVNGTTSYTWTDLDKTDFQANPYTYTVDEVEVPRNYVKTISEDGLTVTNKYKRSSGGGGGYTPPTKPDEEDSDKPGETPKDPDGEKPDPDGEKPDSDEDGEKPTNPDDENPSNTDGEKPTEDGQNPPSQGGDKPTNPDDEKPTDSKGGNPTNPNDEDVESANDGSYKGDANSSNTEGQYTNAEKLPQTDGESNLFVVILGLLLVTTSIIALARRRKIA